MATEREISLAIFNFKIKPDMPWPYEDANRYKEVLKVDELYPAFSLDDDFNIVRGKGCIKADDGWDYHNNVDDSKLALFFEPFNTPNSKQEKRWWTISEKEIEEFKSEQLSKIISLLDDLKQYYMNKL